LIARYTGDFKDFQCSCQWIRCDIARFPNEIKTLG
jgi:hypothetical protein